MNENLKKTDPFCNNIYLIDERMCLSDSFNIINNNFSNLYNSYDQLNETANFFNGLYSYFTANSANWILGSSNTNSKSNIYDSTYSTIQTASSFWTKEFSVFYPSLFEINDYYNNISSYNQNTIKDWLFVNFPPESFPSNQIVYVYLNLYQIDTFTFSFSGKYDEQCKPMAPAQQVCCSGQSCGDLFRGCNLDEGGRHFCINAYSRCGTSWNTACATAGCPSSGGKTLKLMHISNTYNDIYTSRSVVLKYKRIEFNNDWTIQ